jgi:Uma2 family endonuclease
MALLERVVVREAKPLKSVADIPPGTRYVPERLLTVDEFYDLIDEDSPAELDEGAIVMPSPTSAYHEDCFLFLGSLLRIYVDAIGLGIVLGSRAKSRLDLRTAREPDILFVSTARRHLVRDLEVDGAPDLVVEIINSDKGRSEAFAKVPQYERAEVAELWLIDLPRRRVHFLTLRSGTFEETLLAEGDTLRSGVVSGFCIPVSVLFSPAGQYPAGWPMLQELLQSTADDQPID